MVLRDDSLRDGILGLVGAASVDMMEQSSGITGFWGTGADLRPKQPIPNGVVTPRMG